VAFEDHTKKTFFAAERHRESVVSRRAEWVKLYAPIRLFANDHCNFQLMLESLSHGAAQNG